MRRLRLLRVFVLVGVLALMAAPAAGAHVAHAGHGHHHGKNIVQTAVAAGNFDMLVSLIEQAGLADTLAHGGPFTVFAPTDAAFAQLPAGTVETLLQPANRDQLRAILTYHVVAGRVTAGDLAKMIQANGGQAMLTTVQGGTLTARLSGNSVALTDERGGTALVTVADLKQSNGIIHVTNAVSLPR